MIQKVVPISSATASEFSPIFRKLSLQPAAGGSVNNHAPKESGDEDQQHRHQPHQDADRVRQKMKADGNAGANHNRADEANDRDAAEASIANALFRG